MTEPVSRTLIFVGFFLSGFSALVYQIAWQRLLGLFSGTDALSATIIVGAFLLGLGIGSSVASWFADRVSDRRAIQLFALCELAIGSFGCLSPVVFYDYLFGRFIALAGSPLVVLLVVFVALLLPTFLMGLALPLLAKATARSLDAAPRSTSVLYAVNTLGASVGAIVAGWVLVGTLGYDVTIYVAAAVNVAVGFAAVAASTWFADVRPMGRLAISRGSLHVWQWSALVFTSGFLIISLEIVWFRVLGTLMQSYAYAFSLALGILLFGDALGLAAGAAILRYAFDLRRLFVGLQAGVAFLAVSTLGAVYVAHGVWALAPAFILRLPTVEAGALAPPSVSVAAYVGIVLVTVFPASFLLGISFPIAQKAVQTDRDLIGRRVGLIQVANILGNTAGSVVTGLLLFNWFGTAGTVRLIGCLGLLFIFALSTRLRAWHLAASGLLAACVVMFPSNQRFWGGLHGPRTVARRSWARIGRAWLCSVDSMLFIGGHEQSSYPFYAGHFALGAIGALIHPNPRRVLVIGYGGGGTPAAAGINPATQRIDVVEIVQPVFEVMGRVAARAGGEILRHARSDPRLHVEFGDGRHALFTSNSLYDVIEADALYPWTSNSGMLFSVEFFRQVAVRLADGGLCVQWAPTPRAVASFVQIFPYVYEFLVPDRQHEALFVRLCSGVRADAGSTVVS